MSKGLKRTDGLSKDVRMLVASIAWDATVGAGNDAEEPRYERLNQAMAEREGRAPTEAEVALFKENWGMCLQTMVQP
jgi:hypothetical protein